MRSVHGVAGLVAVVVAGSSILVAPASGRVQAGVEPQAQRPRDLSHWYAFLGPKFNRAQPAGPGHWYFHGGKVVRPAARPVAVKVAAREPAEPHGKSTKETCRWYAFLGPKFNRAQPTGPGHWYYHGGKVKS